MAGLGWASADQVAAVIQRRDVSAAEVLEDQNRVRAVLGDLRLMHPRRGGMIESWATSSAGER
jgi:hypothetical protein